MSKSSPRPIHTQMQNTLSARYTTSSLRTLSKVPSNAIDFSSNDFLSLSTSSALHTSFHAELAAHPSHPIGSRGSRLLDGNSSYIENLENEIAAFHGAPRGLLFNSGFDANAGFFACVPQRGDVVVHDEFIHASVWEGMRLSRVSSTIPFAHNCVRSLRSVLEGVKKRNGDVRQGRRNVFVAVEGLYSMDGDLAPLKEIVEVVEELFPLGNGLCVVDEAHSTGIYGREGRGLVSEMGLEGRFFARLHTFGKAMGCNGAILLCDELTRQYLINYARPLIYSTSMSFPSLAAIKASYSLLQSGTTTPLMLHLQALIRHLYTQLQDIAILNKDSSILAIPPIQPNSPIFALLTSEPRNLAKWFQDAGFVVRPIVAPTVPVGAERVRVCLHAGNTFEEVDALVARLRRWPLIKPRLKAGDEHRLRL